MELKKLENIFQEKDDVLLAGSVVEYFKRDYELTKEPVGLESPSFIATIQEDWQELAEKGSIDLSKISDSKYRVRSSDVEDKLPKILQKLVEENYLKQIGDKYIFNLK
ncbi:MAG: hypothetical protein PHH54_01740 [Candidatus Nanoarchaeia archaeon]|nr:hypothetical protein [Candidatus Nanoarchaeia archaeon]MDD5740684.1 hypothetical protein [Candidatus Nanoarchaeia archaeon]